MLRVNPTDLTHPEAHKINKQLLGVHTLASTFDVLRLDKQAALVRRLVQKQQDGTIGQPSEGDMPEEDDTHVVIGDTYNTFHEAAQAAANQATAPPTPPTSTPNTPTPSAGLSPTKAALWAALALTAGGGLGAGSLTLYKSITADDTNTQYQLEFGEVTEAPPQ